VLSAIRHNALKQVANRIRQVFELNVFICVFIGLFLFDLLFVVLPFAIPLPEIRDEVPEKFSRGLNFCLRHCVAKKDTASEVAGRRVSNV
jgi:hypothetical protein